MVIWKLKRSSYKCPRSLAEPGLTYENMQFVFVKFLAVNFEISISTIYKNSNIQIFF